MVIINLFDKRKNSEDPILTSEDLENARDSLNLGSIKLNIIGKLIFRFLTILVLTLLSFFWSLWVIQGVLSGLFTLVSFGKWRAMYHKSKKAWQHIKLNSACLVCGLIMLFSPPFGLTALISYLILTYQELPMSFLTRFVLTLMKRN